MKWIIKKETVSTEYLPLKKLNIMEGDNIVTRLTDKDENSKVNANLIASAPEMLRMLKKLCYAYKGNRLLIDDSDINRQILKLIAKAEGK